MEAIVRVSRDVPVIFPVHPRTRQRLEELPQAGTLHTSPGLILNEPLGYLDFLRLEQAASVVITDSGGVQEETTYLGVPCLTLRENTERPITVSFGTNTLLGTDYGRLEQEVRFVLEGRGKRGQVPPLWDGRSAGRIADVLAATARRGAQTASPS
jgi:UDP-N-acetylglucosamine 2-epimerase (non-hydrolysing)